MEQIWLETIRLEHTDERQYLRFPVTVPEGCSSLHIAYDYERYGSTRTETGREDREDAIVDLLMEAPDGHIGSSGSARREIRISAVETTPGYRRGRPEAGVWQLILGAYQIPEEGLAVRVSVTAIMTEAEFLTGDLHMHTHHSDGWYTVEELARRLKSDRLDFGFLTDHNTCSGWPELESWPWMHPAVELTWYDGHANAYGLKRPLRRLIADSPAEVREILAELRREGAAISLNHIADDNLPWTFGLDEEMLFDWIEVWNGPFTPANWKGLQIWDSLLAEGRRITAVGGSDYHHADPYRALGTPSCFVRSMGRDEASILEAIDAGHLSLGADIGAPLLWLDRPDGSLSQGDVWPQDLTTVRLTAERVLPGDEIRLYEGGPRDAQAKPTESIVVQHRGMFQTEVEGGARYLRAELWRALPGVGARLTALTNPVYWD